MWLLRKQEHFWVRGAPTGARSPSALVEVSQNTVVFGSIAYLYSKSY